MERQYSKNELVSVLTRSPHGKLEEYAQPVLAGLQADPLFVAHLIAWNQLKGAVRDSKLALPLYSLTGTALDGELAENSLSHLALQDPRNFARGLRFARQINLAGRRRNLRRLVESYLRHREAAWGLWERAVLQHRASIKELYALYHIKPGSPAFQAALFKGEYPTGSTLWVVQRLNTMPPKEALGYVLQRRIPFLVAVGALGPKLREVDVILGLVGAMSLTELQTNSAMLKRLGVENNPALRAAYRDRLEHLSKDSGQPLERERKTSSLMSSQLLKTSKAAEAVDGEMSEQLKRVQEKQIKAHGGVKGRWLIAGDKSGSMEVAIEAAKQIAAVLARFGEEAHLVWFDTTPMHKAVTGQTLEQIQTGSRLVRGQGGTHWHVALDYMLQRQFEVDGVVYVSDGGDNQYGRYFIPVWQAYCKRFDKTPTLYFFKVRGSDPDTMSRALEQAGIQFETFDLTQGVDFYSLPTLVQTLRTTRWSLIDQIMETPLLRLEDIFDKKELTHGTVAAST
jgi:hypothetical protein